MESPGPQAASTPFRAGNEKGAKSLQEQQNSLNASFEIISSSQKRKLSPLKAPNSISKKKKKISPTLETLTSSSFKNDTQKILDESVNSNSKLTRSIFKKIVKDKTPNIDKKPINIEKSNAKNLNLKVLLSIEKNVTDEKQKVTTRLTNGHRLSNNNSSKPSFIKRKLYSAQSDYTDSDKTSETSFLSKNKLLNIYNSRKSKTSDIFTKTDDKLDSNNKSKEYSLRNSNKNYKQYFDDKIMVKSPIYTTIPKENTCQFIAGLLKGINNESQDKSDNKDKEEKENVDDDNPALEESDNMFILNDSKSVDKSNTKIKTVKRTKTVLKVKTSQKSKLANNQKIDVKKTKAKKNSSTPKKHTDVKKSPRVKKVDKKEKSLGRSNVAKKSISPLKNIRSSKSKKETVQSKLNGCTRYKKTVTSNRSIKVKNDERQSKLGNNSNKYSKNDIYEERHCRPSLNDMVTSKYNNQGNISYYDSRGELINHPYSRNKDCHVDERYVSDNHYTNHQFSRNEGYASDNNHEFVRHHPNYMHYQRYAPNNNREFVRNNQSNTHLQRCTQDNNQFTSNIHMQRYNQEPNVQQFTRNNQSNMHMQRYAQDGTHQFSRNESHMQVQRYNQEPNAQQFTRNNQSNMHMQRYAQDSTHQFSRNESNMQVQRYYQEPNAQQFTRNNQSNMHMQKYTQDSTHQFSRNESNMQVQSYIPDHRITRHNQNAIQKYIPDMSVNRYGAHAQSGYQNALFSKNNMSLCQSAIEFDSMMYPNMSYRDATVIMNEKVLKPAVKRTKTYKVDIKTDTRVEVVNAGSDGFKVPIGYFRKPAVIDSHMDIREKYGHSQFDSLNSVYNGSKPSISNRSMSVYSKSSFNSNRILPQSEVYDTTAPRFNTRTRPESVSSDSQCNPFMQSEQIQLTRIDGDDRTDIAGPSRNKNISMFHRDKREIMIRHNERESNNTAAEYASMLSNNRESTCISPILQRHKKSQFNSSHIEFASKRPFDTNAVAAKKDVCESPGLQKYGVILNVKSAIENDGRVTPVLLPKMKNLANVRQNSQQSLDDSWIAVKKTPLNCSPWRFTG